MERWMEHSCSGFTAALAARTPVPGGGGAAALAGAVGTALCAMAGNYGNRADATADIRVRELAARAEELRRQLLELADADAEAFAEMSAAWKLPKGTPERTAAVEAAAIKAMEPPLNTVRICAEAMELVCETAEKGSAALLSDAACGALLCSAAMRCAAFNVYVNTRSLQDRQRAEDAEAETDALLSRWLREADRVADSAARKVRGG